MDNNELKPRLQYYKDMELFQYAGIITSTEELFEYIQKNCPDFTEYDRVEIEKEIEQMLNELK